ncbi:hypothetical protein TERTU_2058 [Teredinibacter turnerae T7901]|uniref:Uncharacterized protein n=1 Tax=Teredinibacter turnerae (strain ATCC 39867 / T7901) TaxID=377629 RepID=C5BIS4_TERTT|nr:hypothetical protein [Teredinibacter turnerae]ACR14458.1 hypothetical protein TERTU_2058 [Teredinibacter turnerae T7901]
MLNFGLQPKVPLSKNPLFILAGTVTVIIPLLLLVLVLKSTEVRYSFEATEINYLLFTVLKAPLAVLAALLSALAIIATLHRSAQTAHQISLTEKQNTFANYFEHKKWIMGEIERRVNLPRKSFETVYRFLYPNNNINYVEYEGSLSWLADIDDRLIEVAVHLNWIKENSNSPHVLTVYIRALTAEVVFVMHFVGGYYFHVNTNKWEFIHNYFVELEERYRAEAMINHESLFSSMASRIKRYNEIIDRLISISGSGSAEMPKCASSIAGKGVINSTSKKSSSECELDALLSAWVRKQTVAQEFDLYDELESLVEKNIVSAGNPFHTLLPKGNLLDAKELVKSNL